MNKMIKVRIAIVVDGNGNWSAAGWNGQMGEMYMDMLMTEEALKRIDNAKNTSKYFLEASFSPTPILDGNAIM